HKASSHQTARSVRARNRFVEAVKRLSRSRLLRQVECVGCRKLHSCREFEAGDTSIELELPRVALAVLDVQPRKQINAATFHFLRTRLSRIEVQYRQSL